MNSCDDDKKMLKVLKKIKVDFYYSHLHGKKIIRKKIYLDSKNE